MKALRRWGTIAAAVIGAAAAVFGILQYFHIQPEAPRGPELRVTYYRMTGASADFLVRGLLTPEWEAALGGPQAIFANPVLADARELMSHFQEPLIGDALVPGDTAIPIGANYIDDYVANMPERRRSRLSTADWQAFMGGRNSPTFFLPDVAAMDTYRGTPRMPEGYSVFHSRWDTVGIWRYLRDDDLSDYNNRMQNFTVRFRGVEGTDRHTFQNSTLINDSYDDPGVLVPALQWLSQRGLPPNFLVVVGQPEPHGGWALRGLMRDLEVEVAVLENVGDQPLSIGDLGFRSWGDGRLRETGVTDENLTRAEIATRVLSPSGILAPDERIIVPTRISLVYGDEGFSTAAGLSDRVLSFEASQSGEGLVDAQLYSASTEQGLVPFIVSKYESDVRQNVQPTSPPRFDFGSAWLLEYLVVDGTQRPIRRADWENVSLFLSSEKGSCPFVYTRRDEHSPWISEGHVLLGATRPDSARTDQMPLSRFNGSVLLREQEDEIAYISNVRLIAGRGAQATSFEPANWPVGGVVIPPHESLEVFFPAANGMGDVPMRLEVTGYYRPFGD